MENHHFFLGKSTIFMAMFNSKHFVYQRVYFYIAYMSNFWVKYFGLLLQSI